MHDGIEKRGPNMIGCVEIEKVDVEGGVGIGVSSGEAPTFGGERKFEIGDIEFHFFHDKRHAHEGIDEHFIVIAGRFARLGKRHGDIDAIEEGIVGDVSGGNVRSFVFIRELNEPAASAIDGANGFMFSRHNDGGGFFEALIARDAVCQFGTDKVTRRDAIQRGAPHGTIDIFPEFF